MVGVYILDPAEFEENIDFLIESGIRSLVFGFATPPKVLQRAGENFEVYLQYQPFATGGIPDYFVENVLGEHRDLAHWDVPQMLNYRGQTYTSWKKDLRKSTSSALSSIS